MSKLSLKRSVGQSIHITTADGQFIKVSITELCGRQVKLSVDADKSVAILRDELVDE
mgnify:CR=1 FL=1